MRQQVGKTRILQLARVGSAAMAIALMGGVAGAATQGDQQPITARTLADAPPPSWPKNPEAPHGAPNVLLILTDDVGFGASSTFGGPVPTPVFDALARNGLRYNQFHTTAMCSPTRAALLTGRDSHAVGMGGITNLASGYPGYTSVIPKSAGTIAEVLKQNGYNTVMFGKSHLTPEWETSMSGPFDRWPTGLGFEYFYGFLGADTSQWEPALVENTKAITGPRPEGYNLEDDLTDRASQWILAQHATTPDKPFFMYYASGTAHAPNHAPKDWIAKFRGRFDEGYDALREKTLRRQKELGVVPKDTKLTKRPDAIPAWSSLSDQQKRMSARLMEAFAGELAHTDADLGKLIDALRKSGELDNTLIIFIQGDNGGQGEGGINGGLFEQANENHVPSDPAYDATRLDDIGTKTTYSVIPGGWGWATSAPFQWMKQIASHFGGTQNGMVVSWPSHIKDVGTIRSQFHYVTDVMPTILEAAGISAPATLNGVAQKPMDGISFAYTFDHPKEASHRHTQVFEMLQNLGIYHDGWFAGTTPLGPPWDWVKTQNVDVQNRNWELYNISSDFSQANDLAKKNPEKLNELKSLFWSEAERHEILPIHDFKLAQEGRPDLAAGRTKFTYYPGTNSVPESAAPPIIRKSFTISASIDVGENENGVIIAQGGRFGGYSLYLKGGVPIFLYNGLDPYRYKIQGKGPIGPGKHVLTMNFHAEDGKVGDGGRGAPGGIAQLLLDGRSIGEGRIGHTMPTWTSRAEGLDIGEDNVSPVSNDYTVGTSKFGGSIENVIVTIN